ncbi:MAG: hypothetical protein M3Y59_16050 [Myxococcota bacterium]|nr:hypothetical protein [Myxococcota bacterium]
MKPVDQGNNRGERLESLHTAAATLSRRTEGGGKVEEVLPLCGDLLRRSQAVPVDPGWVDQALVALSPSGVQGYLESLDLEELTVQLQRAADESVEAGLAETDEERELWAASALEALFARDRAQSVLVALRRWQQLAGPSPTDLFEKRLAQLDRQLVRKARTLTALNPRRRIEQGLLDPIFQAEAWWFVSRSGCDDLLRKLAGETFQSPHLESCPECQHDLARTLSVESPPEQHLSEADLWKLELGGLSPAQKRKCQQHAEACLECAQLLWALDEGEKAITGLEHELETRPGPFLLAAPTPAGTGTRPSQRTHREVARREAYRVIAIRGPRMRVLVQLTGGHGLALAVISLPPQRNVYQPTHTAEGLEFDLGESAGLEGRTAKLTVRVTEGADNELLDIPL